MDIKEWNELKKNLKKLPIEQELRLLHASLTKAKNKEVQEKIKEEIKDVQKERDELKEWKKESNAPTPAPSRLIDMAEEAARPRETREQAQSSLEAAVAQAPPPVINEQKQVEYAVGGKQEYRNESSAWESIYAKPSITEGQETRQTEHERLLSETERLREFDSARSIEMYKKKKDSR